MSSLLEYDLVGFQTTSDQANFCRFACDFMGGEMTAPDTLRVAGKSLKASVFPVGIDVESWSPWRKARRRMREFNELGGRPNRG